MTGIVSGLKASENKAAEQLQEYLQEYQKAYNLVGAIQAVMDAVELQQSMQEVRKVTGINTYLLVSLEDDGTLFPYLFNLYFDLRCERLASYVVLKTNFVPVSGNYLSGNYRVEFDFELSDDLQQFSDVLSKVSVSLNQLFPSMDFQSRASSLQSQVKSTILSLKDVFSGKGQQEEDAVINPQLLIAIGGMYYNHGEVCYIPKDLVHVRTVKPILLHDSLLLDSLTWQGLEQSESSFIPDQAFTLDTTAHFISFSYRGLRADVTIIPVSENQLAISHNQRMYYDRDTIFIDANYVEMNGNDTIRMQAVDLAGNHMSGALWNVDSDVDGALVLKQAVSSFPLKVEYRMDKRLLRIYLLERKAPVLNEAVGLHVGRQKIGPLYVDLGRRSSQKNDRTKGIRELTFARTAFELSLKNEVFSDVSISLKDIPLEVKVGRDNGFDDIRYARFHWESEEGLPLGKLGFFDASMTALELHVDSLSQLSGKLSFSVSLDEDTRVTENLVVKQNLSGSCSFIFDQGDLRGVFDFSGIKNLQLAYVSGTQKIAALHQSTITKEGTVKGFLQGVQGNSFQSNGFVLTVDELTIEMAYQLGRERMNKIQGEGLFSVSNIAGLKGELWLHVKYAENQTILSVDADKSSLSLYGFQFFDYHLQPEVDSTLGILGIGAINGSASLRNSKTGTRVFLEQVEIASGTLMSLRAAGEMVYRNYAFSLIESSYQREQGLRMSAHLMVDQNEVYVSDIAVDTTGQVSMAAISGSFKKSHVKADFSLEMQEDGLSGDFDAKFLHLGLRGSLRLGTDSLPQSGSGTSSIDLYNYGYFGLSVAGAMPGLIPGTKTTRLGGQFGYHTRMQLQSGRLLVSPAYGSYMAGFSLGIADVSGLLELAADPALFQFGDSDVSIFLRGELLMPYRKPVFQGALDLYYTYPANVFEGNLAAAVRIPAYSGFLLNTPEKCRIDFSYRSGLIKIESNDFYAEMFRAGSFSGSLSYKLRRNPATGESISREGHLNGSFETSFESAYERSFLGGLASIDASLDMGFKAGIHTHFDEEYFTGTFGYEMYVDVRGTASFSGGSVSVEADAFNTGMMTVSTSHLALEAMFSLTFKCYTNGETEEGFSRSFNQYINIKIDQNGNKTLAFAEN